jgi:hypothetical protein
MTEEELTAREQTLQARELELKARELRLFYATIGQAISTWTGMETTLVMIAALLLDTAAEKIGLILYSIQNFHVWLNIIDDLFGIEPKFETLRDKWTPISAELRTLNDTRVRLAHHTSHHEKSEEFPLSLMPAKFDVRPKSLKYEALTTAEIATFAEKIIGIIDKTYNLLVSMRDIAPFRGTAAQPQDGQPQSDAQ